MFWADLNCGATGDLRSARCRSADHVRPGWSVPSFGVNTALPAFVKKKKEPLNAVTIEIIFQCFCSGSWILDFQILFPHVFLVLCIYLVLSGVQLYSECCTVDTLHVFFSHILHLFEECCFDAVLSLKMFNIFNGSDSSHSRSCLKYWPPKLTERSYLPLHL